MFVAIVDAVREWFEEREIDSAVVDGVGSRNDQTNFGDSMCRVAFEPAEDIGIADSIMFIGEGEDGRRQLANPLFVYEVSFVGYDKARPERDLAHRSVCFDLWEAATQAIHRAYYGMYAWTGAKWTKDRQHGRHGAELVARLELNIPLFDVAYATASPSPLPGDPKPAEPEP